MTSKEELAAWVNSVAGLFADEIRGSYFGPISFDGYLMRNYVTLYYPGIKEVHELKIWVAEDPYKLLIRCQRGLIKELKSEIHRLENDISEATSE